MKNFKRNLVFLSFLIFNSVMALDAGSGFPEKVLIILSSADQLPLSSPEGTSISTGVFTIELMKFLEEFEKRNVEFVFASVDGKVPSIDINGFDLRFYQTGVRAPFFQISPVKYSSNNKTYLRRYRELISSWKYFGSLKLSEVLPNTNRSSIEFKNFIEEEQSKRDFNEREFLSLKSIALKGIDEYDMVYIPGGHAPMVDMKDNAALGEVLNMFHDEKKLISAICHGPIALHSLNYGLDEKGNKYKRELFPLENFKITTVSKNEELFVLKHKYPKVPGVDTRLTYFVNEELEKTGFDVQYSAFLGLPKVIEDRHLITGNGPQAIDSLVEKIIEYYK